MSTRTRFDIISLSYGLMSFAWCTSPLCLQMLRRTLSLAGVKDGKLPKAPPSLPDRTAHHARDSALVEPPNIYLEDLNFTAQPCDTSTDWANAIASWVFPNDENWRNEFKRRFVVIPDTEFDFLCETGTEVHTRVRINDETKTVAKGQLWTEEALPAETIFYGVIQCDRIFNRNGQDVTPNGLLDQFARDELALQIGGKATVGCGQMRCVFSAIDGGAA